MPTALIFSLRPTAAGSVSPGLARAAHAAVLELIGAADAELAARLHADERVKPITVAPLDALDGRGAPVAVNPSRAYDLRVTLLAAPLEQLAERWIAAPPQSARIEGIEWQIERAVCDAAAHPWAGRESFDAILAGALREAAGGAAGRWTIEFATPVTFRQRGNNQPLPLPELVFGSLLDRWNALAPLALPDEIRQHVAEALAVSRFDLRSVMAPTKGGAFQVGAIGRCTYTSTSRDRYVIACVGALARFAFYSGVGAGTARGFGQARLAPARAAGRPATDSRAAVAQ